MPRKTHAGLGRLGGRRPASMRPRPDATENPAAAVPSTTGGVGFNEAAARCHGKPGRSGPGSSGERRLQ